MTDTRHRTFFLLAVANALMLPLLTLTMLTSTHGATAKSKNGFNLDNASISVREIHSGGPPKDGIPAINQPKFTSIGNAEFMHDEDRLLGLVINGEARAYPIRILDHHELVNDVIDDQHFVVSYCPLCGTGMVFSSNIGKGNWLTFGVSGLLYNSDVLLYDRNTDSLWSQIMKQSVVGKLKGAKLPQLPALHTTFGHWIEKYPDSKILSTDTGFRRNYQRSPYKGYENSKRLWFQVSHKAPRKYHPKEQVLGIEINGGFKAYPFVELEKQNTAYFTDEVGGEKITVFWNEESRTAYIESENELLASTIGFWFARFTFHPETEIFTAP
ncbi:MAG: DUF3179 domain-containing protein [bacterium]